MRAYNKYLIVLTTTLSLSTGVLAVYGVQRIDAYVTVFAVAYLLITAVFGYLHPHATHVLNRIGYVLAVGLLIVVAARAAAILGLSGR